MPITLEQRECQCGRKVPPRHCPACGSTNIYGKDMNSKIFTDNDGQKHLFRGFKCRKCALEFHEGIYCEAPPSMSMKARRARDILDDPKLRKAELQRLFGNMDATRRMERGEDKWQDKNPMLNDVPKPPDSDKE